MNAIDRIYENINRGYCYGRFIYNVRFPYFQICLNVSENGEFIEWVNYGSSANRNTKEALQWIIETIFKTTPDEFENKYFMEYRGAQQ